MSGHNIFWDRYYRLNELMLRQIGIWPEQSLTARVLLPIFFIVTIGSVLVPELVRMYDIWGNIDNIFEGLPSMIMIIISWIKLLNGVIKRSALLELINRIKSDWDSFSKSPSSIIILERNAVKGRKLTINYVVLMCVVIAAFMSLPLTPLALDVIIPLNETREKKYMFATEYRVDSEEYYYYILFHAFIASFPCLAIYITVDTIFAVWVQHSCALFEIVGHNLRHADRELDVDISKVHSADQLTYGNLCFCIKKHKEAMMLETRKDEETLLHTRDSCAKNRFANLIESTYSTSLAVVMILNMVIMSITGVLFVIKLDDTDEALRFFALTIAQIYHLYYNSISGQKMIDHSNQISDYAYDSDWSTFSPRAQKLLILIMARAQRACLLTAGKVYIINMENFSAIVQTSVSYFTVFSSLR